MAQRTGHHQEFLFFFCFFVNSFIVVGVRVKAGRCCLFCWVEGYECGWNPQSSATIQVKATKLFSALRVFEGYATSSCYTFFDRTWNQLWLLKSKVPNAVISCLLTLLYKEGSDQSLEMWVNSLRESSLWTKVKGVTIWIKQTIKKLSVCFVLGNLMQAFSQ